ncbi:ELWxxDGT repeat protein [Candidatus Entotheonella palauensis]|uniref:ELWxxDGT repeat protein n=1 Tax=Candidatus Entotheonella palauensis TaxID=93172 RepID=UPI001177544D
MMIVTLTLPLWGQAETGAPFLVKDIRMGIEPSAPASLTPVKGLLFFRADDGQHGLELWQSDGTAAGTRLVADIRPGPEHAVPDALTEVNGTLYFSADDGIHGTELW